MPKRARRIRRTIFLRCGGALLGLDCVVLVVVNRGGRELLVVMPRICRARARGGGEGGGLMFNYLPCSFGSISSSLRVFQCRVYKNLKSAVPCVCDFVSEHMRWSDVIATLYASLVTLSLTYLLHLTDSD